MTEEAKKSGRFNLLWLGVIAILIATVTTSGALIIYHNTGDIYLDRSRPGFLPDEEEVEKEENVNEDYEFEKTGEMTMEVLEEYLEKLGEEVKMIDAYSEPFSAEALDDSKLGIPTE